MQTPYISLLEKRGMLTAPWFRSVIQENLLTSPYWGTAYQGKESCQRMTVPALNVTGWFDMDYPGSPTNYSCMKKWGATAESRRPTLIIGPWVHGVGHRRALGFDYGPEAELDLNGYVVRWLDHFLKGLDNGVTADPPVYVFVMGPNRWRAVADWPLPETQWTKYYLQSAGHANSLKGDGGLTTTAPRQEGFDTYIYDPGKPTFDDYKGSCCLDGAVDTRLSALGDEVLVYSTDVLTGDIEVVGPVEATLYAATSARDTDWMMRLVDVYPDGYNALLTEGVLRARSRDPNSAGRFTAKALTTIEPNTVYQYTIEFWRGTGTVFEKGHRIRVEISSSYYPYYLRNLNSGADNLGLVSEDQAVVATQKIYHGGRYPSQVTLPVIPRR
jgi:putative CocE/NonD family hydrolase